MSKEFEITKPELDNALKTITDFLELPENEKLTAEFATAIIVIGDSGTVHAVSDRVPNEMLLYILEAWVDKIREDIKGTKVH